MDLILSMSGRLPIRNTSADETRGLDYRAKDVVIDGFTISNGDDAVAIQSGASNILVQNGFVGHHSHGMSIGSLGQNQGLFASVSNVSLRPSPSPGQMMHPS